LLATDEVDHDQAARNWIVFVLQMHNGLPFEARIPNATTREVLRDAEEGRNLTHYADADDLFRKLRVKRGQD
jgi:antitoxin component of RelBE/YafQ-DinJ toxin-antitoxin module